MASVGRRPRHGQLHALPRAAAVATLGLALGGGAGTARAQLLHRFDPAERGSRFFAADSLELHGDVRVAAGLVTTYATHLRTFEQSKGEEEASTLVSSALWLHPGASVVIAPGARFGLDVPLALQSGEAATLAGVFHPAPGSPRLGDVRASFDLRLLGGARPDVPGGVLAAGLSAYLPTGRAEDFTGDGHVRVALRLAGAVHAGALVGSIRVGYMYRRDDVGPLAGVEIGSEANLAAAAGFAVKGVVFGPELHGSTLLADPFKRRATPLEMLLGAHGALGPLRAGIGFGGLVTSGLGAPSTRAVFSLEWAPAPAAPRDRDGDGVLDDDDVCPDVAGLATPGSPAPGCPPPPPDRDHDGIVDTEDACPDLAGVKTRDPMTSGCPDADRDGIPDPIDGCPAVAGEPSRLPRFHGCPADADGDGVIDIYDACPDVPGVATADAATNGCPAAPPPPADRDGDGIPDGVDACPDAPGRRRDAHPELSGCPLASLQGDRIEFRTTSMVTIGATDPAMDEIAELLVAHPEIARVRIEVESGTAAEAARLADALVARGVARKRIVTRARERSEVTRVVFRVLDK